MSASGKKKVKPKVARAKGKAKVTKPKKVEKKAAPPPVEKPKVVKKAKKAPEKPEPPAKAAPKAPSVKMGPPPRAVVASRHIDSMEERAARGFSFGELSSAGIPLNTARREDVSVDVRRRSVVEQNVQALKSWSKAPGEAVANLAEKQVAVPVAGKKK